MKKILAVFAILALALSIAHAQLNIQVASPDVFTAGAQADTTLINQIIANDPSVSTSFVHNGIEFDQVDNPFLGSIVVGNGEFGGFFVNVAYLGKESADPDVFGASGDDLAGFGVGGTQLYSNYGPADLNISYHITADNGYSSVNFWHYDQNTSYAGTVWQDDQTHFAWYQGIDIANNLVENIVRIDDRGTDHVDYQDLILAIDWNLNPVSNNTPVPEASTYGIIGAAGLLGLALKRVRKNAAAKTV